MGKHEANGKMKSAKMTRRDISWEVVTTIGPEEGEDSGLSSIRLSGTAPTAIQASAAAKNAYDDLMTTLKAAAEVIAPAGDKDKVTSLPGGKAAGNAGTTGTVKH